MQHRKSGDHTIRDDQRSETARAYRKWYNTGRWRRLREIVLNRDPICAVCHNTPSDTADHIIPHRGDYALFYSLDNLQGVCHTCHSQFKQQIENRGYAGTVDETGWPVDPNHPVNKEG